MRTGRRIPALLTCLFLFGDLVCHSSLFVSNPSFDTSQCFFHTSSFFVPSTKATAKNKNAVVNCENENWINVLAGCCILK